MGRVVQAQRPAVAEGVTFEWKDDWFGRYTITGVGERHVSFRNVESRPYETRAGRIAEPVHVLSRDEIDRLFEVGTIRAVEKDAR